NEFIKCMLPRYFSFSAESDLPFVVKTIGKVKVNVKDLFIYSTNIFSTYHVPMTIAIIAMNRILLI
ncbi:hypothetical protein V4Y02_23600, partial [Escherichia coli]